MNSEYINQPEPVVSILIPTYNREKLITQCVESAKNQSFSNFEIIICDNSSTDNTWEVCQELARNDSRIKVYQNKENLGPVRNWLACAEKASGVFSKILFSDDTLEPTCLEKMVEALNQPSVGLVYSAALIGSTPEQASPCYQSKHSEQGHLLFAQLIIKDQAPVSPGACLLRTKDLLKNLKTDFPTSTKHSFDAHGAGPDVMLMLLTASQYQKTIHIREPLVFFRAHNDSLTIKNENNSVREGHIAAICYFLFNHDQTMWLKYVSTVWYQRLRATKKWISPKALLISLEGKGDHLEVASIIKNNLSWGLIKTLFRVLIHTKRKQTV